MDLTKLGAREAARLIADGEVTSEDLVTACLERISAREDEVRAWAHLQPELALQQARERDDQRSTGGPLGPLHGVPVGIKDIFDTAQWPTENGAALDRGRQPETDSAVVDRLRAAGAVIMGKTVTTEYANACPAVTRNPHDPAHTPGGSSAGSAAAVADGMVPLAIGSQTAGSVIRPAAFCGVVGFKPSFGRISRAGMYLQSRRLDHVGVFARSVIDAAVLTDALVGHDPADGDTVTGPAPRLAAIAVEAPPVSPTFAFAKTQAWAQREDDLAECFAELTEFLGDGCIDVDLPQPFEAAIELHRTVMHADVAQTLAGHYQRGRDQLSKQLRQAIESGQKVLAVDYNRAVDWMDVLGAGLAEVFENCDAILTPAAAGT
ncbi:MAG: amidase, partial [Alphaproteobacteria bacterium]|nr:amidase [Alphaproteobacteria bacterium]